jgi:pimeloyl-ACP methyl ester carboxylesterase
MLPRKYIEIKNLKIAYSDIGKGDPILMIHGFGLSSFSWEKLVEKLPRKRRYIMLDLKGFGYSDKSLNGHFSPFYQAIIVKEFASKLNLKKITLTGHSYGGNVALLSLFMPQMEKRVEKLILIDSAGYSNPLPPFIRQLRIPMTNNLIFNHVNSEILTKVILEETYFNKNTIDNGYLREYASLMRLPGATECLIKCAEQISPNSSSKFARRLKAIKSPTLIIWGEKDQVIPLKNAYKFTSDIPKSELVIIPECGHVPHEERTEDTAGVITDFIENKTIRKIQDIKIFDNTLPSAEKKRVIDKSLKDEEETTPRISSLVHRWSPGIFLIFVFLKILQLLKSFGLKTKESGWRKTMGTYLRTEQSKFGLAVFGLDFLSDQGKIDLLPFEEAKLHVIKRLAVFLKSVPAIQWKLKWGKFRVFRERQKFVDVIDVSFADDGCIKSITPYLDIDGPPFSELNEEKNREICKLFIDEYNKVKDVKDEKRPRLLRKNLRKWVFNQENISPLLQKETLSFIDRLLSGNSIIFQVLSKDASGPSIERFTSPEFIKHKHAGFGLLNISCRFNHSLDEADFWFQFQHVPVDGVPMQEFLLDLKRTWGIRRNLIYPPLKQKHQMEPQRCSTFLKNGKALYQTTTFIDFRPILKLRKKINTEFSSAMGGPATVVSIVMWGLIQHKSLRDRKFLFPVELAECPITKQERAPCAMFIKPSEFLNQKNRIKGFFDFQYEFNRMMNATRARKSASYEMIELYALTFPWLYTLTRKIMPKALGEFIGTVGLTMIKDADMFISPLSDVQSDGFFAIGNLLVRTADKQQAGCVSIRAPREKISQYVEAFNQLHDNLDTFFEEKS